MYRKHAAAMKKRALDILRSIPDINLNYVNEAFYSEMLKNEASNVSFDETPTASRQAESRPSESLVSTEVLHETRISTALSQSISNVSEVVEVQDTPVKVCID